MGKKHKAVSTSGSDILNVAKAGGGVVATEDLEEEVTPQTEGVVAQAEAVAEAHEPAPVDDVEAEAKMETKGTKGGDTDKIATAVAAPSAPAPIRSLMDLVMNAPGLTDEERAKYLAEAKSITESETKSAEAKAMVAFNKELDTELPKFIEELRAKHGVSLEGRRITAYFPKADEKDKVTKVTSAAKGSSGSAGDSTREGFPAGWGKTIVVGTDGKETEHKSPSAAAKSLGLQVTGHRDMIDVFENPTKVDTKEKLPKIYTVDTVKGDHFRITIGK